MDGIEDSTKRRLILWAGVGLAAVAVAAVAVGIGWPAWKKIRETRNFRLARQFLQAGDARRGLLSLRQVLADNPAHLEATHLMADLLTAANSPAALSWRQRVVELSPSTTHRLELADAAVRFENPPLTLARQTLEQLRADGAETNVAYHLLASQLGLRLGDLPAAARHLEEAGRLEPTNRLHQLNLATLRLRHTDAAVADQARRELAGLADDPALGEHALRSLTADSLARRQYAEAEAFSTRLLDRPGARFDDRMRHLALLTSAGSPRTNEWLARLQAEAATNSVRISILVGWLNEQRRSREALDWLHQLDPSSRLLPPVALAEADCHLLLKDWVGLEQLLTDRDWAEHEPVRLTLLTRALREQGRRDAAQAHWRRVLSAPAGRGAALLTVVQMTAAWGWKAETDELLWSIARQSPDRPWAWEALIRLRTEAGDTEGLYRVYSELLQRKPQAAAVKNNVAVLGLLLGRDVDRCSRLAAEVATAFPTNGLFVSTQAFALYRQGDLPEALRLMRSLPERELERPEVALYHAVLLAADGQRDLALRYAALADKGRPLPEEKRLLEQVRAKN